MNIKNYVGIDGSTSGIQGILKIDTGILGSDGSATSIVSPNFVFNVDMDFSLGDDVMIIFRRGSGTSISYLTSGNITLNVNSTGALPVYKGTTQMTTSNFTPEGGKLYVIRLEGVGSPVSSYQWQIYEIGSTSGGGGGSGVDSFNGRTGAVVPASGDYTAAQVGVEPLTAAQVSTLEGLI